MKCSRQAVVALVLVAAVGCVPSLNGIVTEDSTVFDEALVGAWGEPNNVEKWEFSKYSDKQDDKAYRMVYVDNEARVGRFKTYLVEVGDNRWLDVFPDKLGDECELNGYYAMHLIPAHTFVRVESIGDKLVLRAMDPEKVGKLLKENPDIVKYEIVENRVLLTAGTTELREFLAGYCADDKLLGDAMDLPRE